jgi:ubiquinone/menaquinone biosynthesis C-methylase UbiE
VDYDAEEIAAVFGRAAATYDSVVPFFRRFGARLVELAELRRGDSVLDVGAGRGATLIPAAERVGPSGRVLGVDLSEEMVALLRAEIDQRGLANASVQRMDAEALEVEAGSFDVAASSFVLHLLPRPEAAIAELRRALRPGGRCAASVPTGAGQHWDFLRRLFRDFGPRAIRAMPMPVRPNFDLTPLLASGGFEVLNSVEEQMDFVFPDEQAWWDWAWSHGLRAMLELLSPSDLEELRRLALTEVAALRTSLGIPLVQSAMFVIARKPPLPVSRSRAAQGSSS